MPNVFDVCVIGLGAMGSSSAFQLAKRGKRVLGIDQFSPPHSFGSSHGATRVTRQAVGEGEHYVPLVLRSYELWPEIEALSGKSLLSITGGLIMASEKRSDGAWFGSNRFLDQTIRSAVKFGIRHSLLDTAEIRTRFPQFNLVGDERGYYEPAMGFLRPELCIESQLGLAENIGAVIRRNERVLEISPTPNRVIVRTSAAEYDVGLAVVSAGSWVASLLPEFASWFKVQRQVLFWFELRNSIDAFLPGKFPVFIWGFGQHDNFVYGFPAIDGVAGGVKVATEQRAVETNADAVDRLVTQQEIDEMYRKFVRDRLPGLGDKCVMATVCIYTSLPDNGFIIDFHPQHSNIIVVSPCSGHGFKHSAAIGEAVAEMAVLGKTTLDLREFRIARFLR